MDHLSVTTCEVAEYSPPVGPAYDVDTAEPMGCSGTQSKSARQRLSAVEMAILHTVAYADIFDYPLTAAEVHRYLAGVSATPSMVNHLLAHGQLVPQRLTCYRGYFTLPGRQAIVETRRRRAQVAAGMWPRAVRYARIIAGLPFVRLVAVTGALAMNNVDTGADIDYLVVTEPGRLWLCRALVITWVRLAAWRGDLLCPNYFLSKNALILQDRNPFTAHELAHMVPIAGMSTYHRMRQLNSWTGHFLPNAGGPPPHARQAAQLASLQEAPPPPSQANEITSPQDLEPRWPWQPMRAVAETVLKTPPGTWLEGWERRRKVRKFSLQSDGLNGNNRQAEASFCADWCKGHFENYGQRTLAALADRLGALELYQ